MSLVLGATLFFTSCQKEPLQELVPAQETKTAPYPNSINLQITTTGPIGQMKHFIIDVYDGQWSFGPGNEGALIAHREIEGYNPELTISNMDVSNVGFDGFIEVFVNSLNSYGVSHITTSSFQSWSNLGTTQWGYIGGGYLVPNQTDYTINIDF